MPQEFSRGHGKGHDRTAKYVTPPVQEITVAKKSTPPVTIAWLKNPIPLGFSGLFISDSRADTSWSRAWSCCGDDADKSFEMRSEVLSAVTYCGFGRVKYDSWYLPCEGLKGLSLGATGPTVRC